MGCHAWLHDVTGYGDDEHAIDGSAVAIIKQSIPNSEHVY
jgi:hypothetical protein